MPPKKKKEVKAPERDPGEEQQQAFVRQALQSNVMALKERLRTVGDDNEELRKTRTKVERDTHEFVAYFQGEMDKKDELIAALKDRVVGLEFDLRTQVRSITDRLESEMAMRGEAAKAMEAGLKRELARAQEELYALREYRDNKDRMESQVVLLRSELEKQQLEHRTESEALERKFLEDKSRVLRAHAEAFAATRTRAREDAQRQLDADTKRIILDNKRMAEELRFQSEEMGVCQREAEKAKALNTTLARELELHMEKDREWAKLGVRRGNDNKDLSAKVRSLESELSTLTLESDKSKRESAAKAEETISDLRAELSGLSHLVRLKNKELRTIRSLAETILTQRTEVETYFLEALEQVKSEMRRARDAAKKTTAVLRAAVPTASAAPAAGAGAGAGAASGLVRLPAIKDSDPAASGRVELKDLGLEDRERVLRLLFAKINSIPSKSYRPGGGDSQPLPAAFAQSGNQGQAGGGLDRIGGPFGLAAGISPEGFSDDED